MANCCDNIIIPVNPCAGSVPCRRYTSTDCVIHNGTLACGTLGTNPNQTKVNAYFCSALLNLQSQIDEIVADPVPCFEFSPFTFVVPGPGEWLWQNRNSGYQTARYSNVQSCTIRLAGSVKTTRPSLGAGVFASGSIVVFPTGTLPPSIRVFPVVLLATSSATGQTMVPGQLLITSSGMIVYGHCPITISDEVELFLSLDGIQYETNNIG